MGSEETVGRCEGLGVGVWGSAVGAWGLGGDSGHI